MKIEITEEEINQASLKMLNPGGGLFPGVSFADQIIAVGCVLKGVATMGKRAEKQEQEVKEMRKKIEVLEAAAGQKIEGKVLVSQQTITSLILSANNLLIGVGRDSPAGLPTKWKDIQSEVLKATAEFEEAKETTRYTVRSIQK